MNILPPEYFSTHGGTPPDVSVVIRTHNEEAAIGRCLQTLLDQEIDAAGEILLVDSGSTDRTLDIARQFPVTILTLEAKNFTYSGALNLGVANAHGPLVVLLSAHVIPLDRHWLSRLVACMRDPRVAGAHSRELPCEDADLYERIRLAPTFGPLRTVRSLEFTSDVDDLDDPWLYFFSNAAGCIRRSVWEEHPFQELPYAEDLEWARWALHNAYQIVYEPAARVHHSHRETARVRTEREVKYQVAKSLIFQAEFRPWRACLQSLKENLIFLRRATQRASCMTWPYWAAYALWKWMLFCGMVGHHTPTRTCHPAPREPVLEER